MIQTKFLCYNTVQKTLQRMSEFLAEKFLVERKTKSCISRRKFILAKVVIFL